MWVMDMVSISLIALEKLDPNPFQTRVEYPEEELKQLGKSIVKNGLREPIGVRPKGDRYEVCYGERRVRACRLVGLKQIQAIVNDQIPDGEMAAYAIIENLQRKDLNPIEIAKGLEILHEKFGWTQERIGEEVGLTRDAVAQSLRLLRFPTELQEAVSHDTITVSHAEVLSRLKDNPPRLKEAMTTVIKHKLTTRQTERLVEKDANRATRENIISYLASREHLLLLRYLLINTYMENSGCCPQCFRDVSYVEVDGEQRVQCSKCGWSFDVVQDPYAKLIGG
jgi:ParB family chromosome partitioning protein